MMSTPAESLKPLTTTIEISHEHGVASEPVIAKTRNPKRGRSKESLETATTLNRDYILQCIKHALDKNDKIGAGRFHRQLICRYLSDLKEGVASRKFFWDDYDSDSESDLSVGREKKSKEFEAGRKIALDICGLFDVVDAETSSADFSFNTPNRSVELNTTVSLKSIDAAKSILYKCLSINSTTRNLWSFIFGCSPERKEVVDFKDPSLRSDPKKMLKFYFQTVHLALNDVMLGERALLEHQQGKRSRSLHIHSTMMSVRLHLCEALSGGVFDTSDGHKVRDLIIPADLDVLDLQPSADTVIELFKNWRIGNAGAVVLTPRAFNVLEGIISMLLRFQNQNITRRVLPPVYNSLRHADMDLSFAECVRFCEDVAFNMENQKKTGVVHEPLSFVRIAKTHPKADTTLRLLYEEMNSYVASLDLPLHNEKASTLLKIKSPRLYGIAAPTKWKDVEDEEVGAYDSAFDNDSD